MFGLKVEVALAACRSRSVDHNAHCLCATDIIGLPRLMPFNTEYVSPEGLKSRKRR